MFKKLSIDDLQPGMYVEAIAETKVKATGESGSHRIAQKGILRDQAAIGSLRNAGVVSVIVDTAREIKSETPSVQPLDPTPAKRNKLKSNKSFGDSLTNARALYQKAKELQAKAMENFASGQELDIESLVDMSDQFIESLFDNQDAMLCAAMMRTKDDYLLEHSINVAVLLAAFSKYIGLEQRIIRQLTLGGFLHDIGKIKVDDAILKKPGRLTPAEYEEMKRHVEYGIEAVQAIDSLPDISRQVIALHHEKLDGSGYPNKFSGEEISQYGRMASICDCYDAITASRCYKDGVVSSRAFKVLLDDSGKHFDGALVSQFIKCLGVYPVGSLVELKSGKLGVVIKSNQQSPLRPVVKLFYNVRHQHFIEVKDLDLARMNLNDEIERTVTQESLDIDIPRFFDEFIFN
ncbi:MAG: HD-GYP domain-containing protein [Gammaproteobacteria bacterium]|nr:HD-GYP domain-containing protein [Gammaproteobacteria bacterium]